ncbi:MAG: alcohol dehydrogenase catalytic domain-containing protein [Candidatus Atribacteria bacterium]|nr:alcohol dehydrogenase catalytic domain-containing protein [Candidatus Atribacteria bacterium]
MRRLIVKAPLNLSIEDIDNLRCHDNEVIVKIKYCGICGSDIAIYQGKNRDTYYLGSRSCSSSWQRRKNCS